MTDEPVDIAIIGAGTMGEWHARALGQVPGARVVAVVDAVAERAWRLAHACEARWYTSPDDLWAGMDIAGVVIATPSESHHELTVAAARAGMHVLVEKPAALSLAELGAMQRACSSAGVALLVGQTLRFGDLGRALHACAAAGDVGEPVYCHLVTNTRRPWPGGWRSWQTDAARSGGMALHLAIHNLDLALWLLDSPPAVVFAQGADLAAPGLGVSDYQHILVRCRNGASALVESHSSLVGRGNAYQSARLLGTRGQADWSIREDDLLIEDGGVRFAFGGLESAQRRLAEHFVACCRGEAAPLVTAEQARWALAAAVAANRSMASGDAVDAAAVLAEAHEVLSP